MDFRIVFDMLDSHPAHKRLFTPVHPDNFESVALNCVEYFDEKSRFSVCDTMLCVQATTFIHAQHGVMTLLHYLTVF